jgi:hypothetical protein
MNSATVNMMKKPIRPRGGLEEKVDYLLTLVDGDPDLKYKGLRERVDELTTQLVKYWRVTLLILLFVSLHVVGLDIVVEKAIVPALLKALGG